MGAGASSSSFRELMGAHTRTWGTPIGGTHEPMGCTHGSPVWVLVLLLLLLFGGLMVFVFVWDLGFCLCVFGDQCVVVLLGVGFVCGIVVGGGRLFLCGCFWGLGFLSPSNFP